MEVHPPEHAIHSWRDFFIHIATIVVGLLIAIGLEQSVEWLHHRHQRHTAEETLQLELESNRRTLAEDERQLTLSLQILQDGMQTLEALRTRQPGAGMPTAASWNWNDLSLAAWDTARSTGAVSLLPYGEAQRFADLYQQQTLINDEATLYMRSVYRIAVPLQSRKNTGIPSPEEIASMEKANQDSMAELRFLFDLCRSMDQMFAASARRAD